MWLRMCFLVRGIVVKDRTKMNSWGLLLAVMCVIRGGFVVGVTNDSVTLPSSTEEQEDLTTTVPSTSSSSTTGFLEALLTDGSPDVLDVDELDSINEEDEEDTVYPYQNYLGSTVNAFHHFGLLYSTMKVLPSHQLARNGKIFRRETRPIIEPLGSVFHQHTLIAHAVTEDHLQNIALRVYACHTIRELLDAYFDDMVIDGLEEPWRAFYSPTAKNSGLARRLKLDPDYFSQDKDYRYVLVKAIRQTGLYSLNSSNAQLLDHYMNETKGWHDLGACLKSAIRYGTHTIEQIGIGDVLLQVFVYTPEYFKDVIEKIPLGRSVITDLEEVKYLFTPWYVERFGELSLASNDPVALEKLKEILWDYSLILGAYTNILEINTPSAWQAFQNSTGGVVTSIDMQMVFKHLPKTELVQHCERLLRNSIRLWEANS